MLIMISPLIISFFILLLFSAVSSKLLNVEINNIIPPMMKMAGAKNGIDIYIDCVLEKSVTRCVKLTTIVNMIAINFWSVMYTGFNFYQCKTVVSSNDKHRYSTQSNKVIFINYECIYKGVYRNR